MSQYSFNFASRGARMTSPPRSPNDGYPLDLDGSLDFVRPAKGFTVWPNNALYPNNMGIGTVSALMPQMDLAVYQQMIARLPAGPSVGGVPADPMRYIGQVIFPQLQQVGSNDQGVTR